MDSVPIDITSSSTMETIQKLILMRIKKYVRLEGMYAWGVCTLRGCIRLEGVYAWKVCTLEGCVPFAEGGPRASRSGAKKVFKIKASEMH